MDAAQTTETNWLTPLMHMIEPPSYSENGEFQKMGKRVWVRADGERVALPSLMGFEPEGRPQVRAQVRVWLTVDCGPRKSYRSVDESLRENDAWITPHSVHKIRRQIIECASAVYRYHDGRELFFELGRA